MIEICFRNPMTLYWTDKQCVTNVLVAIIGVTLAGLMDLNYLYREIRNYLFVQIIFQTLSRVRVTTLLVMQIFSIISYDLTII